MTTDPHGRQDECREQKVEFLRSRIGKGAWLGICEPTKPMVHGHRMWLVVAVSGPDRPRVTIRNNYAMGDYRTSVDYTVGIELVVRGGIEPPPPDECHFLDEWDQGLSEPPSAQDVIGMATKAQDA